MNFVVAFWQERRNVKYALDMPIFEIAFAWKVTKTKKGPQGLLHSVMKGDSKSLLTPVIELFLLPGRGGFSRPDKDFLPRE